MALKRKDKVKDVRWAAVQYDDKGQLQRTTIADPDPPPVQPGAKAPKPKTIDPKKSEEIKGLLGGLAQLVRYYSYLTPDQTQIFAQRCTLAPDPNGGFQLEGGDLIVKGDHLILRVDADTFLMRQLNIETSYNGKPVTIIVSFTMLSDGVAYPSLVDLLYPAKEAEVIVKNLNYKRLRAGP
jgi:hypothetical protein